MIQMFKVEVTETESGEFVSSMVVPVNVAIAILGGYENDKFYTASAGFSHYEVRVD